MTQLAGQQPNPIYYDKRAAQYRGAKGRFVSRAEVLGLLEQEIGRTEVRLQAVTRLLISDKIDLPQWQLQMAATLKDAHLRMAMLGAGGKGQLDSSFYGAVGYQLRKQYEFLDGFAQDLHAGKLTPARALQRAKLYGSSIKTTFYRSEQLARTSTSWLAKRLLDSQAKHCQDCLGYYQPRWTPASQLVSPGANCACGSRCRCRLVYKPG